MGGEGTHQTIKYANTEQSEKLIEAIRKIQPGWFRLLAEVIGGIAFFALMHWTHYRNNGLVFVGGMCIGVFSRDLKLRFRLNVLLYTILCGTLRV